MNIAPDKKGHAKVGLKLAAAAAFIACFFATPLWALAVGFGLATAAGVGKELIDLIRGTGTPEILDALFTSAGGAAGAALGVATYALIIAFIGGLALWL